SGARTSVWTNDAAPPSPSTKATVSRPPLSSTSAMTTAAPARANSSAAARPIPAAAPVTTATRPSRSAIRGSPGRSQLDEAHERDPPRGARLVVEVVRAVGRERRPCRVVLVSVEHLRVSPELVVLRTHADRWIRALVAHVEVPVRVTVGAGVG